MNKPPGDETDPRWRTAHSKLPPNAKPIGRAIVAFLITAVVSQGPYLLMFALLNRGQLNKGYTVNDQSILNLTQGFFWLSLVIGTFSFAYSMNLCIKLLQRRESVVASWICLGLHIALTLYAVAHLGTPPQIHVFV